MSRRTREVAWVGQARKAFEAFPRRAQDILLDALTIAAEGGKADIAKPMTSLGPGVMEIALAHRGDAYRAVYALQLHEAIWVVHAFRKKSKRGIQTPRQEIDLIRERLKRLKEQLR